MKASVTAAANSIGQVSWDEAFARDYDEWAAEMTEDVAFGCGTHAELAVVDSHAELVDGYLATAAGVESVAAFGSPPGPCIHLH